MAARSRRSSAVTRRASVLMAVARSSMVPRPPLLAPARGVLAVVPVALTGLRAEPCPAEALELLAAHRAHSGCHRESPLSDDDPAFRHLSPLCLVYQNTLDT